MEEIVDLIATQAASSQISDKIKEVLYAKAADRLDALKPYVANSLFGDDE